MRSGVSIIGTVRESDIKSAGNLFSCLFSFQCVHEKLFPQLRISFVSVLASDFDDVFALTVVDYLVIVEDWHP